MPKQVAILHGWSDDSDSFKPLAKFLKKNGYRTVPLFLGDYISLRDDVKIDDVAKRMRQSLSPSSSFARAISCSASSVSPRRRRVRPLAAARRPTVAGWSSATNRLSAVSYQVRASSSEPAMARAAARRPAA